MALGSIVIDLLMRTGAFETDTRRAQRRLRELEKSSRDFATALQASFGGNLLASAASELVSQLARIPQALGDAVREAANFKDIEERIGAAAEEFAGFAVAAGTAGTSMQSLEDFTTKLIKNLSKVDDESKGAGAALAALGIPVQEFKRLDPVGQIERLSKALASFRSGPEQTAVLEALARGGAQLLPFLKALEEQGGRTNILTREQILLADDLADRQAKAAAELKAFIQAAIIPALPALTALTTAVADVVKAMIGIDNATQSLSGGSAIAKFAENAARSFAQLLDFIDTSIREFKALGQIVVTVATRDFEGFKRAIEEFRKADATPFTRAFDERLQQQARARNQLNAATDPRSLTFERAKPRINTAGLAEGTGDKANAEAKRQLDQSLRAIESAIDRERALLSQRQRFLDIFNSQGLVSIRDYYDAQHNIIEEATENQATLIALQIKALEDAQKKLKPEDRTANQTKINDLLAKGARLEQEASQRAIELTIEQTEAERRLGEEIKAINADVLELQGNLADAAAIRFDQSNFERIKRLTTEGQLGAVRQLDSLRKSAIEQAKFSEAQVEAGRITEALRLQEERIQVLRQVGATSELEALARTGDARKEAIAQLEALAKAQEAIARASGNADLALAAERTRLELEKLKAVADPLGDTFRGIFTDSASSALEGFITGTKSAKEAFAEFVASVLAGIARIVAQNIAQSLFGQGTSGGNLIGSFVQAIFGGSRAAGGDVLADRGYWVGERGPEWFAPRTAGTIVPATQAAPRGNSVVVHQNFTYHGSPDRRTQQQTHADAARGLQDATRDL